LTTRDLDSDWLAFLDRAGLSSFWLARLEFASETQFVWTGTGDLAVSGTGDTELDGNTFHALTPGVLVNVGDNVIQYGGSDALPVSIGIPSSPPAALSAAVIDATEYQGRMAWFWQCVQHTAPLPGAAAVWLFKRIRAGFMDTLTVRNDGETHTFTLGVESHQAMVTGAARRTLPLLKAISGGTDIAGDFAANIANNSPAPARAAGLTLPNGLTIPRLF